MTIFSLKEIQIRKNNYENLHIYSAQKLDDIFLKSFNETFLRLSNSIVQHSSFDWNYGLNRYIQNNRNFKKEIKDKLQHFISTIKSSIHMRDQYICSICGSNE